MVTDQFDSQDRSPRHRVTATVQFNEAICREHYRLRIVVRQPIGATRPGQFIQLGCRPPAESIELDGIFGQNKEYGPSGWPRLRQPELLGGLAFLRRPFSIAGRGGGPDADDGGDEGSAPALSHEGCGDTTWLEVIHRVVGTGTQWLAHLKEGDEVDFIGPLGNCFELPDDKSTGLLVGGGVGLPPMLYLAEMLHGLGSAAVGFIGATTAELLAVSLADDVAPNPEGVPVQCVRDFARFGFPTVVSTDDGSLGLPGRITDGLERTLEWMPVANRRRVVVYACGPEPMMRRAAELAERYSVSCQVCLEQAMACGMGTCQSCIVRMKDERRLQDVKKDSKDWRYRLACSDGPVFDARDVVWQE